MAMRQKRMNPASPSVVQIAVVNSKRSNVRVHDSKKGFGTGSDKSSSSDASSGNANIAQEAEVGYEPDEYMVLVRKPSLQDEQEPGPWKPIAQLDVPAGNDATIALRQRAHELHACAFVMYSELRFPVPGVPGSKDRVELGLRVQRARAASEETFAVCDTSTVVSPAHHEWVPSRIHRMHDTTVSIEDIKRRVYNAYSSAYNASEQSSTE